MNNKMIEGIKQRILAEHRKHQDLDWAEIAARKIYSAYIEPVDREDVVKARIKRFEDNELPKFFEETNESIKIKTFEIIVHYLLEKMEDDVSLLRINKLLFFLCAYQTELLDVFKFTATPLGTMEKDICDYVKEGKLNYFKIDDGKTERIKEMDLLDVKYLGVDRIKEVIEDFADKHEWLLSMTQYDLIELNKKWFSWQKNYKIARENDVYQHPIPNRDIIGENKLFNPYALL